MFALPPSVASPPNHAAAASPAPLGLPPVSALGGSNPQASLFALASAPCLPMPSCPRRRDASLPTTHVHLTRRSLDRNVCDDGPHRAAQVVSWRLRCPAVVAFVGFTRCRLSGARACCTATMQHNADAGLHGRRQSAWVQTAQVSAPNLHPRVFILWNVAQLTE